MIEGLSFLILLFIAMPLKYHFDMPIAVSIAGWVHGLLFMAYIFLALETSKQQNWSGLYTGIVLLAGAIPFACFFLDKRLKQEATNPQ